MKRIMLNLLYVAAINLLICTFVKMGETGADFFKFIALILTPSPLAIAIMASIVIQPTEKGQKHFMRVIIVSSVILFLTLLYLIGINNVDYLPWVQHQAALTALSVSVIAAVTFILVPKKKAVKIEEEPA